MLVNEESNGHMLAATASALLTGKIT